MKTKIILPIFIVILFLGIVLIKQKAVSADGPYDSGKWVAVYGGGSEPQSCQCVGSFWHNKCATGDTTTDLSLCGGGMPDP